MTNNRPQHVTPLVAFVKQGDFLILTLGSKEYPDHISLNVKNILEIGYSHIGNLVFFKVNYSKDNYVFTLAGGGQKYFELLNNLSM